MARTSASKPAAGRSRSSAGRPARRGSTRTSSAQAGVGKARVEAVMRAAEQSGLLRQKSGRIGGRVSALLIAQAKRQTGIEADTELIEFALASVALEDDFAKAFIESRGRVDPGLKLGF